MDPTTFSNSLGERLLDFAWEEWAQMGISAVPRRESRWAQDPEALIVFTLQVARADPRLFDELLDWMLLNESLLSVRRLRAVCVDGADRALVAGSIGWLARRRPRARLRTTGQLAPNGPPELLFAGGASTVDPDPDFATAGLRRPNAEPSGKSHSPDVTRPINLDFRLRRIFGVSIRAEVVRVLLCTTAPLMRASALARSTVYSKRNVHDSLTDLAAAEVVKVFTVGGEQRYEIDKSRWSAWLDLGPGGPPAHHEWPQLFGVLRRILRWSQQPELTEASDYIKASRARQLLDELRPDLSFAGVPTNLRTTAEDAPAALEKVIDDILTPLEHASGRG
ncbi:MAG: hypothetical protein ACRDJX_05445 [Solirubrobacteraceae bacterium]